LINCPSNEKVSWLISKAVTRSQNSSIKSLSIHGAQIDPDDKIRNILRENDIVSANLEANHQAASNSLAEIYKKNISTNPLNVKLVSILEKFDGLSFNCEKSGPNDRHLNIVLDSLSAFPFLTSIDLSFGSVGKLSLNPLLSCISKIPGLKTLNLKSTGLTSNSAESIIDCLIKSTALRDLDLSYAILDQLCFERLKELLISSTRLHSLYLNNTGFTADAFAILKPGLMQCSVQQLFVANNPIFENSTTISPFWSFVEKRKLQQLDISGKILGDDAALFPGILKQLKLSQLALTSLNMSEILLKTAPDQFFEQLFASCPLLTDLYLRNCGLSSAMTSELCRCVRSRIRILDLEKNDLSNCFNAVSLLMSRAKNLENLNLSETELDINFLELVFDNHPLHLQHLNLSHNFFGENTDINPDKIRQFRTFNLTSCRLSASLQTKLIHTWDESHSTTSNVIIGRDNIFILRGEPNNLLTFVQNSGDTEMPPSPEI
jgi:hypothetical protein